MKQPLVQCLLTALVAVTGWTFCPTTALANTQPTAVFAPAPLDPPRPQPAVTAPAPASDFTDAEFVQADQPQWSNLAGGDLGGVLIFVFLVLLLILLIIWLSEPFGGGAIVEIHGHEHFGGHEGHEEHGDYYHHR